MANLTKEWLIKRGYNMAEGARALKKLMEKEILEPLILLSQTYDLSRADIVIDVDETGGNLSFRSQSVPESQKYRRVSGG